MSIDLDAVRASALFVSPLQASETPSAAQVAAAITTVVRARGTRACAGVVAGEFGDHPEVAVVRMRWALAAVRSVYSRRSPCKAGRNVRSEVKTLVGAR